MYSPQVFQEIPGALQMCPAVGLFRVAALGAADPAPASSAQLSSAQLRPEKSDSGAHLERTWRASTFPCSGRAVSD